MTGKDLVPEGNNEPVRLHRELLREYTRQRSDMEYRAELAKQAMTVAVDVHRHAHIAAATAQEQSYLTQHLATDLLRIVDVHDSELQRQVAEAPIPQPKPSLLERLDARFLSGVEDFVSGVTLGLYDPDEKGR